MMERVDESVIEAVKRGEPVTILGRRYVLADEVEVERLRAIEAQVRALHINDGYGYCDVCADPDPEPLAAGDCRGYAPFPCATVRLLDGES